MREQLASWRQGAVMMLGNVESEFRQILCPQDLSAVSERISAVRRCLDDCAGYLEWQEIPWLFSVAAATAESELQALRDSLDSTKAAIEMKAA